MACGIMDCMEVLTGQEDRITLLTYSVYWLMKTAAEIGGTEIMTKKKYWKCWMTWRKGSCTAMGS